MFASDGADMYVLKFIIDFLGKNKVKCLILFIAIFSVQPHTPSKSICCKGGFNSFGKKNFLLHWSSSVFRLSLNRQTSGNADPHIFFSQWRDY